MAEAVAFPNLSPRYIGREVTVSIRGGVGTITGPLRGMQVETGEILRYADGRRVAASFECSVQVAAIWVAVDYDTILQFQPVPE